MNLKSVRSVIPCHGFVYFVGSIISIVKADLYQLVSTVPIKSSQTVTIILKLVLCLPSNLSSSEFSRQTRYMKKIEVLVAFCEIKANNPAVTEKLVMIKIQPERSKGLSRTFKASWRGRTWWQDMTRDGFIDSSINDMCIPAWSRGMLENWRREGNHIFGGGRCETFLQSLWRIPPARNSGNVIESCILWGLLFPQKIFKTCSRRFGFSERTWAPQKYRCKREISFRTENKFSEHFRWHVMMYQSVPNCSEAWM